MIFVDYVRYYHKEQQYENLETAINRAIDRCIEEGVLAEFLKENRADVVKVTQLDYTFDRQIMLERADAREEGWEDANKKTARKMLKANKPVEEIMEFTDLSEETIRQLSEN